MLELRWFVEEWEEYLDGMQAIKHTEKPVLQYRQMINLIWSEWEDVPTVYGPADDEL